MRTQGDMVWVEGERKWMLRTMTVTMMDKVTRIMVKSRYLPISGTTSDVGGMISASSRKKTVRDSRIEIHREIFSPSTQIRYDTTLNIHIVRSKAAVEVRFIGRTVPETENNGKKLKTNTGKCQK